MSNKSTTILYIYTARRSFVNTDLSILEKYFQVVPFHFRTKVKWLTPWSFVCQFLYLLIIGWKYDVFISFFAGYQSVLPTWFAKVIGKKSIIFLGGTDCFKYPSFHYGNFTRKWYGKATCISAHNASLLIPVSANLIRSHSEYYKEDFTEQGIYQWCSPLSTPYQVIPLEYNANKFFRKNIPRTEKSFITVAFGIEGTAFIRKGIDKVIMLASHLPDCTFTILGCDASAFPANVSSNVNLIPPVPYDELPNYYSQHQFYLQLSIAEGFPSAICEAMLCECIPIGSDVAAIPEIIGDNGFLVLQREDAQILETVNLALRHNDKIRLGKNARQHIIDTFGEGKRADGLVTMLNKLLKKEV